MNKFNKYCEGRDEEEREQEEQLAFLTTGPLAFTQKEVSSLSPEDLENAADEKFRQAGIDTSNHSGFSFSTMLDKVRSYFGVSGGGWSRATGLTVNRNRL